MASISKDPNGNVIIQFVGGDKRRRTIRLGKVSQKTAEAVKLKVEHLNNADLPALWIPKPNQFFAVESIPTLGTGKTDLRKSTDLAIELASQVRQPAVAD